MIGGEGGSVDTDWHGLTRTDTDKRQLSSQGGPSMLVRVRPCSSVFVSVSPYQSIPPSSSKQIRSTLSRILSWCDPAQ